MSDAASKQTNKQIAKLDKQINQVYSEARKDLEAKLDDFNKRYQAKNAMYIDKLRKGEITPKDYNNWMQGQIFQGEQWVNKIDQITDTLHNSNKIATNIINKEAVNVFTMNGNYTAYQMEHSMGVNFGFGLYDESTVTNLIKKNPQILPKWKIDEKKDYIWNKKKVNNAITQGVIQGEKLDQITKRLSEGLCAQNENKMKTFARTGMTQAQNAGRLQRQYEAKQKGINVVKMWMATLDSTTRDTHRVLDGEVQTVKDIWHPTTFSNGCEYPGDPGGPPGEVYNCRCTMTTDVEDFPAEYERYDNIDGKPIKNMTYKDWYKAKFGDKLQKETENKLAKAQQVVQALQDEITAKGADKVFKGIWKDDVTYADWEAKKDSIQAKREWYKKSNQKQADNFVALELNIDHKQHPDLYWKIAEHDSLEDLLNDKSFVSYFLSEVVDKDGVIFDVDDLEDIWKMYKGSQYTAIIKKNLKYLDDLNEFEKNGAAYSALLQKLKEAKSKVANLTPKLTAEQIFGADAYSQTRKNKALWAKSAKQADDVLRNPTGEIWRNATDAERKAAYKYTSGSGSFNRPLRGYDYSWYDFKGIGQVPLNNEGSEKDIKNLVNLISKSKLQQDTWLQRGVSGYDSVASFLQIPESVLQGSQEDLEQLLIGKEVSDAAFMSCGSAKGSGFSGTIFNVYCPQGTQALYCEPFSAYGGDSWGNGGRNWDGIATQSVFGSEDETLLQAGTKFRVIKVEKSYGNIFIDLEVIGQDSDLTKYN